MADRPRRNTTRHDYRILHTYGFVDDDVQEFASDDEESDEEINPIPESEEDDDVDNVDEDIVDEREDDADVLQDEIVPESTNAPDGTIWTSVATENAVPAIEPYVGASHLKPQAQEAVLASEFFDLMFTHDVLWSICFFTNKYAKIRVDTYILEHPNTKLKPWQPLTVTELKGFFGLILLAGIEKGVHQPFHEFWSKNETIRRHVFPATMSRNRFKSLLRFMRFDDADARRDKRVEQRNAIQRGEMNPGIIDKFEACRNVFSTVVNRFYALLVPGNQLIVDEEIVKFKGRCSFRVYMKSKPGKYGIKLWAIVDLDSGFVLDLQPYLGKSDTGREIEQGKRVVLDLAEIFAGSGRNIVGDNFFSSLRLCEDLRELNLTYLGTLRKNRREVPDQMKDIRGFPADSSHTWFHENSRTMVLRYIPKQNKSVLVISSSKYNSEAGIIDDEHPKPELIDQYNHTKYGVDIVNQSVACYYALFPTKRWPMRLILHLLHVVVHNVSRLHRIKFPAWRMGDRSWRRILYRDLIMQLVTPAIIFRKRLYPNVHMQIRNSWDLVLNNRPNQGQPLPQQNRQANIAPRRRHSPEAGHYRRRQRCEKCGGTCNQRKFTSDRCCRCNAYVCKDHRDIWCQDCTDERFD